jgi:hypothetical protein
VDEPHGNGSMDSHYQRVQDDLYLIWSQDDRSGLD